jgi:hypothetical protein
VKDPTPLETPVSSPPRFCHLDGNTLLDDKVLWRRHDIFTGLLVDEPRRIRRCTGPEHSMLPVIWTLEGDYWIRLP